MRFYGKNAPLHDRERELLLELLRYPGEERIRRRLVNSQNLVIDRKLQELARRGLVVWVQAHPHHQSLADDRYEITPAGRAALEAATDRLPDPAVYLSVSEGRYRIISRGMPVAPDRNTAQEALDDARRFKLKVADRFWDGDVGNWKPMQRANRFDPTQDYDDYAPARGHAEDTSQMEIERAQADDDYERFIASLDGPPEDMPSFEVWWREYRMNPSSKGRYVVTVPGLPGERVFDEHYDEIGSPLEAAQRVAMGVHSTPSHPRQIRVYDRQTKQPHIFQHAGGDLAPNTSHRERASEVLAGRGDPGAGIPIANASEVDFFEDNRFVREGPLWQLSFGAYGSTHVYVWADGADSAFEEAVEWLDDHAPGMLTMVSEEDYQRAAEELGKVWDPSEPDDEVIETAEADMTMIGHTTLKHGNAVASWEWQIREVERGSDEWNEVVERSREESGEFEENGEFGQAGKIYQRIQRIGPYLGEPSPTPHDLTREFALDLNQARWMIGLWAESTGPGGRGEAWFMREASKVLARK